MRDYISLIEAEQFLDYVHFPEYHEHQELIEEHVKSFAQQLITRGYKPSVGHLRVAMISPDRRIVIKIPLSDSGMTANNLEQRAYTRFRNGIDNGIPIAACRIFFADKEIGAPMLMMRYVKPLSKAQSRELPDWTQWVDCQQIGYDHKGDLVAYDL